MSIISHPLVAALILIAILIFVHEFGHFIVGRLCGIGVEIFSIGFGPEIVSFKFKNVNYKLCWIPLGGYVKFYGAYPLEEIRDDIDGIRFSDANPWKKVLTVSAGPVANFLFACVAYIILGYSGVPYMEAVVGEVRSGSVAEQYGLISNDKIVKIDGKEINNWEELKKVIAKSANKKLNLEVLRDGKIINLNIVPEEISTKNIFGKYSKEGKFGISLAKSDASFYVDKKEGIDGVHLFKIKSILNESKEVEKEINYSSDFYSYLENKIKDIESGNVFLTLDILSYDQNGNEESRILKLNLIKNSKDINAKNLCILSGIKEALLVSGKYKVKEEDNNNGSDVKENIVNNQQKFEENEGLRFGDILLEWDQKPIQDVYDLSEKQLEQKQQRVSIKVKRNGVDQLVWVNLDPHEVQLPSGKETLYVLPVEMFGKLQTPQTKYLKHGVLGSLSYGVKETLVQTKDLVISLWNLIIGNIPLKALGGPMLIAKVASDSVKAGFATFLGTLAIISINLGVLNLFPIPVLDGGQFVIYSIEGIRRKKLSQVAIDSYQKIGFIMVMALVILATYNDFSRFWTSMLKTLSSWFN